MEYLIRSWNTAKVFFSCTRLDEADFFPSGQQLDARDVTERYIAKSNSRICNG